MQQILRVSQQDCMSGSHRSNGEAGVTFCRAETVTNVDLSFLMEAVLDLRRSKHALFLG
jgi:hypothetical protein